MQIEIAFKRLKSLLHIDKLRGFDPDLAQTYRLAKLWGAVLVDSIRTPGPDLSLCGSDELVSPIPQLDQSTPRAAPQTTPSRRVGWLRLAPMGH